MISRAAKEDLPDILDLQFRAFGEIAKRLGRSTIPPLEQTMEHLQEEAETTLFLKYEEQGHILGSVRGRLDERGICHVGKLIVDPECRNRGIGQKLMLALEEYFGTTAASYLLFTSADTPETLHLYRKLGYTEQGSHSMDGMVTVFLEKQG